MRKPPPPPPRCSKCAQKNKPDAKVCQWCSVDIPQVPKLEPEPLVHVHEDEEGM